MNQHRLWSDPEVRAARQPAAEAFMGRPMEFDGQPRVTANGGAAFIHSLHRPTKTLRKSTKTRQ